MCSWIMWKHDDLKPLCTLGDFDRLFDSFNRQTLRAGPAALNDIQLSFEANLLSIVMYIDS